MVFYHSALLPSVLYLVLQLVSIHLLVLIFHLKHFQKNLSIKQSPSSFLDYFPATPLQNKPWHAKIKEALHIKKVRGKRWTSIGPMVLNCAYLL